MWIRANDMVQVISGEDRGTRGKVLRVDRTARKLVVEGVNRVYKHVRRSQKNPQGGRLSREMPIAMSNVLLICEKCGAPTRLGARFLPDGGKERYCRKCGAGNGQIAPARTREAKKPETSENIVG
jgi:large subunit ribosomal protein L24